MDQGSTSLGSGRGGFGPRVRSFGPRGGGFGPLFGLHPGHYKKDKHLKIDKHFKKAMKDKHLKIDKHFKKAMKDKHFKKNMKDKHSKKAKKNKQFKKFYKSSIDPVGTTVTNQDGKFTISMDLGMEAKAEDVKVNVRERDIYIEITMTKWSEDGTSHLSQVFTKKVALPEKVKLDSIKSNLTPEGVLKIEASIPVPEEITIPVSMYTEPTAPLAEN